MKRVAQTSLREMIGSTEQQRLLPAKDVSIPSGLQDAMSRQAQAEREKDARVTLASAEREIAAQVVVAAAPHAGSPHALQPQQMNLLYELNRERGTTALIRTEMANSLGSVVGLTQALAKPRETAGCPP